jgi:glutamine amidotransferase
MALPDMIETLDETVRGQGRPFLGVCVGMQLMAETGEEHGTTRGLGWCRGTVRAIEPTAGLKVPHMGWNDIRPTSAHPLIEPGEAYFLHSFAYEGADVLAETDHGGPRAAAVGRDNMLGVQFHPEKSQRYGLALLARFLEWRP